MILTQNRLSDICYNQKTPNPSVRLKLLCGIIPQDLSQGGFGMKNNVEAKKQKELREDLHCRIKLLQGIINGYQHEKKKASFDNVQSLRLGAALDNYEEKYGVKIESRHQARKLLKSANEQLADTYTDKTEKTSKKEKGCRNKECYRPQTTR